MAHLVFVIQIYEMGSRTSRTEKEKDMALTMYVDNTIKNELKFKNSKKEVKSIKKSVHIMVDCIMNEVQSVDERLEMLRKVPVGSMAEGMRIVKPDEFDFMIVLKGLSKPGVIEVRHGCENLRSFAHAHLTAHDDDVTRETWHDVCKDGNLKSTPSTNMTDAFNDLMLRRQRNIGIRELFCEKVQQAVKKLQERHYTIRTTQGTLSIKDVGVEIHGPAITPLLNWRSVRTDTVVEISVDLVPAIEVKHIHALVNENDACSLRVFQELERTGRLHLTPAGRISPCKQGMCFQVACSETEVKLVKSLNPNHKKCYKILKDMFKTRDEVGAHLIISYVLKTLAQKHASNCSERKTSGACIMKLLRTIDDNYLPYRFKLTLMPQVPELGTLFFKEQNIFYFKEIKGPMEVFGSTTKQLIKDVNRVREKYPIIREQTRGKPDFRIQIQQHSPSAKRLAFCALSLPLSYIMPMFLVYLSGILSGVHLPEFMHSVSLYFCFIFIFLLPGLQTWLAMSEIFCSVGRIILLAYACILYMPWGSRFFLAFSIMFYIVIGRTDLLQIRDAFIYADIYSLWKVFVPALIQWRAMVLTWERYVKLKELEMLIWRDNFFPTYLIASMSFIYVLNLKHRHSCLRSKWLSRLTGLVACSMWLFMSLLWGDPNYFLITVTGSLMSFSATCILPSLNLPVSMKVFLIRMYKTRFFARLYKLFVGLAVFCGLIIVSTVIGLTLYWFWTNTNIWTYFEAFYQRLYKK